MVRRALSVLFLTLIAAFAEDWPEWRGRGRGGVWTETGILEAFPTDGLKVRWRAPLKGGFAGPAVSKGRVFVTDFDRRSANKGIERAVCLDEKTGRVLWTREWEADYTGLMGTYAIGPRATPTADGDRVYVLGAKGALLCLRVQDGETIWKKDYVADYGTDVPTWGMTGAPLVDGDRLMALVGGKNNATVVSFDKHTGREIWRAISQEGSEPGYSPPFLLSAGGAQQLIQWTPTAVRSLDPSSGKIYWEHPFRANAGLSVGTPVRSGNRLLFSSFYNGSLMLELDAARPAATVLWKGKSASEIATDGLHALINTPVIDGDYIYGICSYGQMRCLNARTGERIWETLEVTGQKARWATGLIVRNGDRYFINNDRGDLIIARFSPEGYREISRTHLIKPTSTPGNRREANAVNWSHPAYAGRHIFARNDQEILSASLEK